MADQLPIDCPSIWAAPGCSSIDGAQGESQRDVETRMLAFLESLLTKAPPGSPGDDEGEEEVDKAYPANGAPINSLIESSSFHTVALFTHGMAIKCVLRAIEQSSPAVTHKRIVSNTSITEVKYSTAPGGAGGWFVERVNDTAHVRG